MTRSSSLAARRSGAAARVDEAADGRVRFPLPLDPYPPRRLGVRRLPPHPRGRFLGHLRLSKTVKVGADCQELA